MIASINWGDPRLPDRFWSKVQPEPMGGCWLWVGAVSPEGYGRFNMGEKLPRGLKRTFLSGGAHRVSYQALVGSIPDGLHIDHLCRVPCCCNPAHMEPVTNYVNTMRGENFTAKHTRSMACPQGHPYDRIDYSHPSGRPRRVCKRCRAATMARFYARHGRAA